MAHGQGKLVAPISDWGSSSSSLLPLSQPRDGPGPIRKGSREGKHAHTSTPLLLRHPHNRTKVLSRTAVGSRDRANGSGRVSAEDAGRDRARQTLRRHVAARGPVPSTYSSFRSHAARRRYSWCSPPTRGTFTTLPWLGSCTVRGLGASFASDKCVRVPL